MLGEMIHVDFCTFFRSVETTPTGLGIIGHVGTASSIDPMLDILQQDEIYQLHWM